MVKPWFKSSSFAIAAVLFLSFTQLCNAQTTGATFGDVIRLGGTPSDVVLDESRGRLYLVNSNTNQIDFYDYVNNALSGSISVGTTPVAAARSMDGNYLYVSNNGNASLSAI